MPPVSHQMPRRRGGGFRPTSIAGCGIWLRGDLGVTTGATFTWADQSGNGRNFSQSTAALQPTLATAINSRTTVHFTAASSQLIQTSTTLTYTAAEAFIVVKGTTTTGGLWNFSSVQSAGSDAYYTFSGNDIYENFGSSGRVGPLTPTTAVTNAHVHNVQSAAGSYNVLMDGTNIGTSAANTVAWPPAKLTLGSNVSIPQYFNGDLGEVIVYDHVLTTADRASVMAYLRGLWATP